MLINQSQLPTENLVLKFQYSYGYSGYWDGGTMWGPTGGGQFEMLDIPIDPSQLTFNIPAQQYWVPRSGNPARRIQFSPRARLTSSDLEYEIFHHKLAPGYGGDKIQNNFSKLLLLEKKAATLEIKIPNGSTFEQYLNQLLQKTPYNLSDYKWRLSYVAWVGSHISSPKLTNLRNNSYFFRHIFSLDQFVECPTSVYNLEQCLVSSLDGTNKDATSLVLKNHYDIPGVINNDYPSKTHSRQYHFMSFDESVTIESLAVLGQFSFLIAEKDSPSNYDGDQIGYFNILQKAKLQELGQGSKRYEFILPHAEEVSFIECVKGDCPGRDNVRGYMDY